MALVAPPPHQEGRGEGIFREPASGDEDPRKENYDEDPLAQTRQSVGDEDHHEPDEGNRIEP